MVGWIHCAEPVIDCALCGTDYHHLNWLVSFVKYQENFVGTLKDNREGCPWAVEEMQGEDLREDVLGQSKQIHLHYLAT